MHKLRDARSAADGGPTMIEFVVIVGVIGLVAVLSLVLMGSQSSVILSTVSGSV